MIYLYMNFKIIQDSSHKSKREAISQQSSKCKEIVSRNQRERKIEHHVTLADSSKAEAIGIGQATSFPSLPVFSFLAFKSFTFYS